MITTVAVDLALGQSQLEFKTYNHNGDISSFSLDLTAENYGVSPALHYQNKTFKSGADEREPCGSLPYKGSTLLIRDGYPLIKIRN